MSHPAMRIIRPKWSHSLDCIQGKAYGPCFVTTVVVAAGDCILLHLKEDAGEFLLNSLYGVIFLVASEFALGGA